MKRAVLLFGFIVLLLAVIAHPAAFADDDDDGPGASPGVTAQEEDDGDDDEQEFDENFILVEEGTGFRTAVFPNFQVATIQCGDWTIIASLRDPNDPFVVLRGSGVQRERLFIHLTRSSEPGQEADITVSLRYIPPAEPPADALSPEQFAQAFIEEVIPLLAENRIGPFTGRMLGSIATLIGNDVELHIVNQNFRIANPTPQGDPPDPCKAVPCDPTKCKGCPDPPPDPPEQPPGLTFWECVDFCNNNLSTGACAERIGCDMSKKDSMGEPLPCVFFCETGYRDCLRDCIKIIIGPEREAPGPPIIIGEPEPAPTPA